MSVYSTMLEHMSDEQKITVTAKLAQEVLSAVIDGGLPLANSTGSTASSSAAFANGNKNGGGAEARKKASSVVKDALTIMASPGIRVGGRGGAAASTEADDGSGRAKEKQVMINLMFLAYTLRVFLNNHSAVFFRCFPEMGVNDSSAILEAL